MAISSATILDNAGLLNQPEYVLFRKWHAENKMPLIVFFGSGLSVPSGLPDWEGLRKGLHKLSADKINSLNKIGDDLYGLSAKLNTASTTKDFWLSFKLYKEILTDSMFVSSVRELLTPKSNAKIPEGYAEILKLTPRGLITVNLDHFAANAMKIANPFSNTMPVFGKEIGKKWENIQYSDPFLVYLHGNIVESDSWVLTLDDLKYITEDAAHKSFLEYVFLNFRILFFGISADDASVSGRLIGLRNAGFRTDNLFWLTSKPDNKLRDWASANNIKIILYKAIPSHTDVFKAFVDDCNSYIPKIDASPPIISKGEFSEGMEEIAPEKIANAPPEEIRQYINRYVNYRLFTGSKDEQYKILTEIISKYKRAIHNSYYLSPDEGDNVWFGNKLEFPPLGEGTFGEVYQANTSESGSIAVKIMREAIHTKSEMLGGFRRGVRSMKIVNDANLPGMVKILDAHEIPPTILMEKVDGVDIDTIIANGYKFKWFTKIHIIIELAKIVRSAHLVSETVIHRDIKPTNVMIKSFDYSDMSLPEIVVLDFDMSWHKGSEEKDVIFEARDDFAYLAPEQVVASKSHLSRSTLVDSYGLGMTAYYLFAEAHPQINAYLAPDWESTLRVAARKGYTQKWISAPRRVARLINKCTLEDQKQRADFGQIIAELSAIRDVATDVGCVSNGELFAEEIMAQIIGVDQYDWNVLDRSANYRTSRGLEIKVNTDNRMENVVLIVHWVNVGFVNRGGISKYLDDATQKSAATVASSKWKIVSTHKGTGEVSISIAISVDMLKSNWSSSISVAKKIFFNFDFA